MIPWDSFIAKLVELGNSYVGQTVHKYGTYGSHWISTGL